MASNATIRQVVFDVLRTVRENHPEAKITRGQVAYWVIMHADRLRRMHIGQTSTGRFMVTYPSIDALVDPITGRNYCVIPASIYDMEDDKGIAYLSYDAQLDLNAPAFTSTPFTRTTPLQSRRLYMSEDEKPSASNPYFYTSGERIYFLGCEQINLLKVEAGLYTTLQAYDPTLDLDVELDIPQVLIPTLKNELLSMGLFVSKLPKEYNEQIKETALNVVTNKDLK
ncbi:hypothetical protein LCGC14_0278430 [marine sediment metagenome]|uniref:Uncharacterized protein n=1 Tax=marine sediment metagenome TaxID=412755 RepID=A0A0F9TWW0_9ZZZZ